LRGLAPEIRRCRPDGHGPKGSQPPVVGAGADGCPRAVPADEPAPVEDAQPVLGGALGHPGEADKLAGGEYLVLAEQSEQAPI